MVLRGVLIIFVASGCASAVITARPAPELVKGNVVVDAGVADAGIADASVADAGVQVVVVAPVYVSTELQPCSRELQFSSLAEVMRARPSGEIAVRAPMWKRPTAVCTDGLPPYCVRYFVLAASRMTEANEDTLAHLDVVGEVGAGAPFACTGGVRTEACPLQVDGRAYGLVGTVAGASFIVKRVCRL